MPSPECTRLLCMKMFRAHHFVTEHKPLKLSGYLVDAPYLCEHCD
jgi:hypothetical protein